MLQIDGCNSGGEDGQPAPYVMVLAATNYPWDLDEALRQALPHLATLQAPKCGVFANGANSKRLPC